MQHASKAVINNHPSYAGIENGGKFKHQYVVQDSCSIHALSGNQFTTEKISWRIVDESFSTCKLGNCTETSPSDRKYELYTLLM